MGKIQFDGSDDAGTRYCVYLVSGSFASRAGVCTQ